MSNHISDDILSYWINKDNTTVCKRWYLIWCKKIKSIALYNIFELRVFHSSNFQNLTKLAMYRNTYVDFSIHLSSTLKKLILTSNIHITNENLAFLTNLKSLSLRDNTKITCIKHLTNLCKLKLEDNKIEDLQLQYLTNITKLDANYLITDHSLIHLTKLEYLSLKPTKFITDKSIVKLTNLRHLAFNYNSGSCNVTYQSLKLLTNLTSLKLSDNIIDDNQLINFTNLKTLNLYCINNVVTGISIERLINLQFLCLHRNNHIMFANIYKLTNLTELEIRNCRNLNENLLYSNLNENQLYSKLPKLRLLTFAT